MIFYFSATGNSKQVAKRLAEKTGEELIDIAKILRDGDQCLQIEQEERIGFVFPTYFWGLPNIVREFLRNVSFEGYSNQYCYMVTTYGSICGGPHYELERLLKRIDISLDGCFNVKMVDVWTPLFDVSNPEKNARETAEAQPVIAKICEQVASRTKGNFMKSKAPAFTCKIAGRMYESSRKTSNFHVEPTCNGCKLCEKQCPVHAIKVNDGQPIWTKDKCEICLRCLHHCPKFAIQYGKRTKRHGQYVNRG